MLKCLFCFGVALAIIPLQAQTPGNQNNNNQSKQPVVRESISRGSGDNSRLTASNDVSMVLNDTNKARHDVAYRNKQLALDEVNDALYWLKQTKSVAPHEKPAPLYTETDSYSVMGPILANRNSGNNQINTSVGKLSPSGQIDTNPTGAQPDLTVQRAYGELTSVSLNTELAGTHLQAAREALQKGDFRAADTGLKATQDAVITASTASDLPLLRARENLTLARGSADSGDYPEVHVALQAARNALENYARLNGARSADAKNLAGEIGQYDKSSGFQPAELSAKIDSWWNETAGWINSGGAAAD